MQHGTKVAESSTLLANLESCLDCVYFVLAQLDLPWARVEPLVEVHHRILVVVDPRWE